MVHLNFVLIHQKFSRKKSAPKHRSTSHRQYTSKHPILPSPPFLSSTVLHQDNEQSPSVNFDTESIISSHCHLPVLPVFKDHSLLPFRSTSNITTNKTFSK